jgi:hypothetical protein
MKSLYLITFLLASITANATTLDFENYTINEVGSATLKSLSQNGYTISIKPLTGNGFAVFSAWSPQTSTNGFVSIDPGGVNPIVKLVENNGNYFNLTSIDLANLDLNTAIDITFTGITQMNETVTQTFNLPTVKLTNSSQLIHDVFLFDNFNGLKEVSWSGWNSQIISISFDNINVTEYVSPPISSVPLPAAAWLFLSGISLIGLARKTKQN